MKFKTGKTVWLNNGYGVEFIITDPSFISWLVLTERDRTLVVDEPVCIGAEGCAREENESDGDFAVRARDEAFAQSKELIVEHKASLELSATLGSVLDPSNR